MALMQIHSTVLVDREALVFVRFENMDQSPTAVLRFKDGSSETVTGDAARQLQEHLNSSDAEHFQGTPARTAIPVDTVSKPASQGISATFRLSDGRSVTSTIPAAPFIGRNKAWFCRKDENGREFILAFVNAKGSCSLRTFDENGIFLGKHYRSGNYQDQFAELLAGATELTVNSQPNLERDCKERLPAPLLSYLRQQVS